MLHFFKFELRTWLRAPLPWIFLLIIALLSFLATISDQVNIGGSFGNIWKNAPYVAQTWYSVWALLGILLTASFVNSAALRDFENNTNQIVFSKPISKAAYFFGHFLGGLIVALLPFLGTSLGMWLGWAVNPIFDYIEPTRFGPFEITGHIQGILVFAIPNTFFIAAILYTVASLTRSTLYAFIAAAALLVGYIIAGNMLQNLERETIAALIDPFGLRTFEIITKYWTIDDKNHHAVGLSGMMLLNRLIWIGVGFIVLMFGYWKFSFSEKNRRSKKEIKEADPANGGAILQGNLPTVSPQTGSGVVLKHFVNQFKTEYMGVIKSTPFILLTLLGLVNTIPSLLYADESYGTHELPITYTMVDTIRGSFYLFLIIIVLYFSGLLIWKERNARMADIYDALPTKNWTGLMAKYFSVLGILAVLYAVVMAAAILIQKYMGYNHHEMGVFFRELFLMDLSRFAIILALSMLIQALSRNMYLGFFITIVFLILNSMVWGYFKIDTNMLQFASRPQYTLSNFYGYQPFIKGLGWFSAYWLLFANLLLLLAVVFWPRGRDLAWKKRFSIAGQEWKNYKSYGVLACSAWVLVAGWVYFNTKILNKKDYNGDPEKLQAQYEDNYKKRFEHFPQPLIYDVNYNIQLFPEERTVIANGKLWVRNDHPGAIDTLIAQMPDQGNCVLKTGRLTNIWKDSLCDFHLYRIEPALAAGDSMLIEFETKFKPKGFENEVSNRTVVQNGTFFNNSDISPSFAYNAGFELSDKNRRKKFGLPEKSRMPALNPQDTASRQRQYINSDANWVMVETTISTSDDQLAIAPGSLIKSWKEGNRNFYTYRFDHKGWNFFSFMSGRYVVKKEDWNGVSLEIYHHPDHTFNIDRMMKSIEKSLDYYTKNFGPYYQKQCRIIEFPRFASFAQAFPGTMPYSEGIGFIQDYKDPDADIDMVFYVVAHEMGHQWWAHQECGANMQGGEMLTETFAQYSALMVMEREYGRDLMRKFLRYELDRYLRGRSSERLKELPINQCEGQGYVHYAKGSLVMYALKEMIGEAQVNKALKAFLEKYRYQEPPFPTSTDAIQEFRAVTPDSLQYLIKDLFEDITLFENRTIGSSLKELGNGQYEVTIQVESKKLKGDSMGKETEVPVNDWIEIGAFAKPEKGKKYGKTLYRERIKMDSGAKTFTFTVNEKPDKAGIDPFSIFVDRNPEDNLKGFN